jgi:hypothetical protein
MTETGWPLIPRELLPAPIPPAKTRLTQRAADPPGEQTPGEAARQLSIFGAETTEPSPADLAGLLAGPGRLGRIGGTARVSVRVDAAWRVHVLVAELLSRGLVVTWQPLEDVRDDAPPVESEASSPPETQVKDDVPVRRPPASPTFDPDADATPDPPPDVDFAPSTPEAEPGGDRAPGAEPTAGAEPAPETDPADTAGPDSHEADTPEPPPKPRFEVRTAYSSRLNGLARAWPGAAAQLFLSGPRLRLWVAAAGEPVAGGYALGLEPGKDSPDELLAIDAALVRAGLAGQVSDDGRHYVITGRRRLKRLAELVGERPTAAPDHLWPGGAGA